MSLPITIEGQKYFVTLPSLADFRTFKNFLASKLRRELSEMIPPGLSDDELKRRFRCITDECEAIDPFRAMGKLTASIEGAALLFYAWLRHENPGVTLDWLEGLLRRCEENKPAALEGLCELRHAMTTLLEQKKSEAETKRKAEETPAAANPNQSTSSGSTSG